tara:strand:+ start:4013 stop:5212 length:1200 start_codon:yes stop_codon:yes gene_type:complete
MAVEQQDWQTGSYGNWGEKLGEALANRTQNIERQTEGVDEYGEGISFEPGTNAGFERDGFGHGTQKKSRTGIFATIDKIMTGGQQYVNENMPGFRSGGQANNQSTGGITKYKNGEIVSGPITAGDTPTGGQINVPKIMTPLLASLHKGMSNDKGLFQGGREGRVFGRLRDRLDKFKTSSDNRITKYKNGEIVNGEENISEFSGNEIPKFDINNNEEVATMQNMLIDLGYMSGDSEAGEGADGMFGKNTEAAWRAYVRDQRFAQGKEAYVYDNTSDEAVDYSGESVGETEDYDYTEQVGESIQTGKDPYGYGTKIITEKEKAEGKPGMLPSNDPLVMGTPNPGNIVEEQKAKGQLAATSFGEWYEWADENGNVTKYDWNDPKGPLKLQQMNPITGLPYTQ